MGVTATISPGAACSTGHDQKARIAVDAAVLEAIHKTVKSPSTTKDSTMEKKDRHGELRGGMGRCTGR